MQVGAGEGAGAGAGAGAPCSADTSPQVLSHCPTGTYCNQY